MATNPQIDLHITVSQLIGAVGGAISIIVGIVLFALTSIKDDLRHAITEQSESLRNVSSRHQENIRDLIQNTKDDTSLFRDELKILHIKLHEHDKDLHLVKGEVTNGFTSRK